jgi:hypothetical protein
MHARSVPLTEIKPLSAEVRAPDHEADLSFRNAVEFDPLFPISWMEISLFDRRGTAESGATRTPIPEQGGQHSGDCGQRVMMA